MSTPTTLLVIYWYIFNSF